MSEVKEDPRFQLEVVKWEGKLHCCYLNNFRIAGGKPWAGGETVKSWSVPLRELISAVPELRKLQSDFDAQRLRADTAEAGVQASVEVINSLHDQIAADEQRIAELLVMLRQAWVDDHVSAADCRKIDAALNPNPEAESHEKY